MTDWTNIKNYFIFSYEPELHPGVTYKIKDPKATLKIFSTGSITITAPSVTNVQRAVEHIYPYVEEHAKAKLPKVVKDISNPDPKSRLIFLLCFILYNIHSALKSRKSEICHNRI